MQGQCTIPVCTLASNVVAIADWMALGEVRKGEACGRMASDFGLSLVAGSVDRRTPNRFAQCDPCALPYNHVHTPQPPGSRLQPYSVRTIVTTSASSQGVMNTVVWGLPPFNTPKKIHFWLFCLAPKSKKVSRSSAFQSVRLMTWTEPIACAPFAWCETSL